MLSYPYAVIPSNLALVSLSSLQYFIPDEIDRRYRGCSLNEADLPPLSVLNDVHLERVSPIHAWELTSLYYGENHQVDLLDRIERFLVSVNYPLAPPLFDQGIEHFVEASNEQGRYPLCLIYYVRSIQCIMYIKICAVQTGAAG